LLDLKSKEKLVHLKNLILFDKSEDFHITLASQVGFNIFQFEDLVREGFRTMD